MIDGNELLSLLERRLAESDCSTLDSLVEAVPAILAGGEFINESFVSESLIRVLLGHRDLNPECFEEHDFQLSFMLAELSTLINRTEVATSILNHQIKRNCDTRNHSIFRRAECLRLLASCRVASGEYASAKTCVLRGYRLLNFLIDQRGATGNGVMRAMARMEADLGSCLIEVNDVESAEPHLRSALRFRQKHFGPLHPDTIQTELSIARWAAEVGQLNEAYSRSVNIIRTLHRESMTDHPGHPKAMDIVALVCVRSGNLRQAHRILSALEEYLINTQNFVGRWVHIVEKYTRLIEIVLESDSQESRLDALKQLESAYRCRIKMVDTSEGTVFEVRPIGQAGAKSSG